MKPIIENAIKYPTKTNCTHTYFSVLDYFNELLIAITTTNTREELWQYMKENINLEQLECYFKYGWGGSHFWVKQIVHGKVEQQVIFVQFED
jgi:hypothetical protein